MEKTMNEELKHMIKSLRLKGLIKNWQRYLKLAGEKDFSHLEFLKYIIEEEYQLKQDTARHARLKRAKIPETLLMETFPFEKQPKLNKNKILNLFDSGEYIEQHQNIIWIGPTGTGKTGLATAFLIDSIEKGYKGFFITFPELIDSLYRSVADHSEEKIMRKYASYDCLLVDELGYVEMETTQVSLFFTLMAKRHKRKTTFITSNLGFSQWDSFLKNNQLTAALIDRLTEKSHIISMKDCSSLRKKLNQV